MLRSALLRVSYSWVCMSSCILLKILNTCTVSMRIQVKNKQDPGACMFSVCLRALGICTTTWEVQSFFGRPASSRPPPYRSVIADYTVATPGCLLFLHVDTQRPCLSSLFQLSSKLITAQTPRQKEQGKEEIRG